jgi:hypothetical protein
MRHRPSKEDLMVCLFDVFVIDELQLRDDRTDPQFAVMVQVRDVTYDKAVAVEGNRVPLLDQTP